MWASSAGPRRRRRSGTRSAHLAAALALVAIGSWLAGCGAPAATTAPAPSASDPVCARVMQLAPAVLAGAEQRATTSQGSLAWGDPPITLRCGVAPLPPTDERCITVAGPAGPAVDWVVAENDDVAGVESERGRFVFTTYGRIPAVEVVVPVEYAGTSATSVLLDLAAAIGATQVQRQCYDLSDVR